MALGLGTLLVLGSTSNVKAQAAEAQGASGSPDLPHFTLREIVAGRNDTLTRIPGRWAHAALAALPESRATLTYREAATLGTEPALRRAWRAYSGKPDRRFRVPASKILIPEVTFTIEDGFPEVIASRILIPPRGKGAR